MKHNPYSRAQTLAEQAPTYLSLDEAAAIYGCHPRTIRRMVSRSLINGYRLPGSRLLRVRMAEIEEAMHAIPTGGAA